MNQPKYTYAIFGDFDLNEVANLSLTLDIELEEQPLSLDLNFEAPTVSESQLTFVNQILSNLSTYKDQARAAIFADSKDEESVTDEYLDFHQEAGESEAIDKILAGISSERKRKKKLRHILHLNRIGFYPHDATHYAVFDYTIGEDLTNYLLVVVLNNKGEIQDISMES
ncbi:MAG: DUF2004 domain-containing protein [Bacteroidota bacterium]